MSTSPNEGLTLEHDMAGGGQEHSVHVSLTQTEEWEGLQEQTASFL